MAEDDADAQLRPLGTEQDDHERLSSIGDVSGSVRFSTNSKKIGDDVVPEQTESEYMDLAEELPTEMEPEEKTEDDF